MDQKMSQDNNYTNAAGDGVTHYEGIESDGAISFGKMLGHLSTVLHHKRLVAGGCFKIGLYRQGIFHDLSKFSPTEFWNGVRFFQGGSSLRTTENVR